MMFAVLSLAALTSLNMYVQLPLLIVVVSLVYSATRYDEWDSILYEAFRWGSRMAGFLAMIGLVLVIVALFIR